MTPWELLHDRARPENLGYIPDFLSEADPDDARTQLHKNYRWGGFEPFEGFKVSGDRLRLTYPGDPPMHAIGRTKLRDEEVYLYECSWVAVFQPDGSHVIARMD